jgi:hypothetical protein
MYSITSISIYNIPAPIAVERRRSDTPLAMFR